MKAKSFEIEVKRWMPCSAAPPQIWWHVTDLLDIMCFYFFLLFLLIFCAFILLEAHKQRGSMSSASWARFHFQHTEALFQFLQVKLLQVLSCGKPNAWLVTIPSPTAHCTPKDDVIFCPKEDKRWRHRAVLTHWLTTDGEIKDAGKSKAVWKEEETRRFLQSYTVSNSSLDLPIEVT